MRAVLIILLSLNFCYVYSQTDTVGSKKHYVIKTDILLPALEINSHNTIGSLTFEFCFKHRHSVQLTGLFDNYLNTSGFNGYYGYVVDTYKHSTLQIIPEYKYFLSKKKAYTGFYSGIYLKWIDYSYSNEDHLDYAPGYDYLKYNEKSFGCGFLFGYQNYIKKRWVFDLLLGFGFRTLMSRNITEEVNIGFYPEKETNPDGRIAINIGYKF